MTTSNTEIKRIARENLTGNYRVPMMAMVLSYLITSTIQSIFQTRVEESQSTGAYIAYFLASVIAMVLSSVFALGISQIHLNLARGKEVHTGMIFHGFRQANRYVPAAAILCGMEMVLSIPLGYGTYEFLRYFNASDPFDADNLKAICIFVGGWLVSMILLYLLQLVFGMFFYVVLDYPDMTIGQCMKGAVVGLKGNRGALLGLFLSFLGMGILGLLSFGLGFLWVGPYYEQSVALFYLDSKHELSKLEEEKKQKKTEEKAGPGPTFEHYV